MDTNTTTEWASWVQVECSSAATLEDSVSAAAGEWLTADQVDVLIQRYRVAINEALPDGVRLHGDLFIGPYPAPWDAADQLADALKSVGFWGLAAEVGTGWTDGAAS